MTVRQLLQYGQYGDLVKLITSTLYIDKLIHLLGINCNCDVRQYRWNKFYVMTKMKVFKQRNCPHCEKVVIPEHFDVEVIYLDDGDYDGVYPPQVPFFSSGQVGIAGDVGINTLFENMTFKEGYTLVKTKKITENK